MSKATVTASIDKAGKRVILKGDTRPDPTMAQSGDTFALSEGDTLVFELRDLSGNLNPDFGGFVARVRFVGFPHREEIPLLEGGNTLEAVGGVMQGIVRKDAHLGRYLYLFELVDPSSQEVVNLVCFWERPDQLTGMGGGPKVPPPPPPGGG